MSGLKRNGKKAHQIQHQQSTTVEPKRACHHIHQVRRHNLIPIAPFLTPILTIPPLPYTFPIATGPNPALLSASPTVTTPTLPPPTPHLRFTAFQLSTAAT